MTAFAVRSMTNHHGFGVFSRILRALQTWHDRSVQRGQLAQMTEQELHDMGLSRSTIAVEVEKPFWRP